MSIQGHDERLAISRRQSRELTDLTRERHHLVTQDETGKRKSEDGGIRKRARNRRNQTWIADDGACRVTCFGSGMREEAEVSRSRQSAGQGLKMDVQTCQDSGLASDIGEDGSRCDLFAVG